MTTSPDKVAEALRVSIKETERLRRQNQRLLDAAGEPIAIVGMSCRFPGGADSPERLWRLLGEGRDAIGEFPADRGWDLERLYSPDPDEPGTSYAREGGFLPDAAEFDPAFFSISPREALTMDPQQRLLLEASWEALEDAGIDPLGLRGSRAGVFAGVMFQDYGSGPEATPGMTTSPVTGRVAYTLGLEGPAMTVDTACSSSLVAMHLACQALRGKECTLALAGGVTVLATPGMLTYFSRQQGMAPDGRSKPFAEAANGVGLAEGVGLLVLERLSEAEAKGRRVLAVIRGSAVNQDGASNGLTAPNGPSQERVIRQALANARLEPGEVDVVEAHGTGTTLGDPIEANALLATYGQEREKPLLLGSVKSNIGHTQAAAGVAGVIKAVLAMGEGMLPKTLHVDTPSSKVDWEAGDIELLTEATEWKADGRPRRAGVSSFGASGTNAHLILEEAPVGGRDPDPGASAKEEGEGRRPLGGPLPFLLSARSPEALAASAERLAAHLGAHPEAEPADLAFSLATTRARLEHRAAVMASDPKELQGALAALAAGEPSPLIHTARATSGRLAFLFTGQGSQRAGMGLELYASHPAYSEALDEACEQIDPRLDRPLKQLLFAEPDSAEAKLLDHTTFAQPAIFATELALHRTLASFGLSPELLIGHSVGEIVAAHIAGVFDLPDAAKLICARGALMGELPAGGAMLAIEASEAEALALIEGKGELLSLAAVNAPAATVISGDGDAIAEQEARWQEQGRKTKRLAVSHAFHSPLIEPMLEPFSKVLAEISFSPPTLAIVSNASGELLTAEQATDPAYWVAQAREPVRFADGICTLKGQGADIYVELGPEAVLCAMAAATLQDEAEEPAALIATLREGRGEAECLVAALARAEAAGAKLDWDAFFAGTGARAVPLPTYPFRRKRYWLGPQAGSDPSAIGLKASEHPLLGAAIEDPEGGDLILSGRISLQSSPWLADHALAGTVLLPGTAFMELALEAAARAGCEEVTELLLPTPLILPETGGVALRVKVGAPSKEGEREISIHSRPEGAEEAEWSCNARGVLAARAEQRDAEPLAQWPPADASPLDADSLYDRLTAAGFDYGPAFQGLDAAWSRGEEIFAAVSLAPEQAGEAERFSIHPALLDAAFHAALLGSLQDGEEPAAALPFAWERIAVAEAGADALRVRLRIGDASLSLAAFDQSGNRVLDVGSVNTRELDPALLRDAPARRLLHLLEWRPLSAEAPPAEAVPAQVLELEELSGHSDDLPAAGHAAAQGALARVQAWLADEAHADERLVLLTTNAVIAAENEDPDLPGAAVWGLLRSVQSEHPGRFALIDSDGTEASAEALPAALSACASEPQLALRQGRPLVPRLVPAGREAEQASAPRFDPESTALIVGGAGGIGARVARHLVEGRGARRLLLASRRGPAADGVSELQEELEELGAEVSVASCDVSDRAQVETLLGSIDPEHPLGAVVHCAAVLDDGVIASQDAERLERAMRPKVDGAWHLHELTQGMELSAFVLFSSIAGTLGGPGQANYSAANAFLDGLAHRRRTAGLPATSIAWGAWALEEGMTAALTDADKARLRRAGIETISAPQGLALFDAALACGQASVVAASFGLAALRDLQEAGALAPPLRGLLRGRPRRAASAGSEAAAIAKLDGAERERYLLELVKSHAAAVLGHDSSAQIDPGAAFRDLGFDSLAAIELRNRLGAATGQRLSSTVVFDYPSAAELAAHLSSESAGHAAPPAVTVAQASEEPIAIVGMSCRFPGGADSPERLWQLLGEGRDAITEFPADRGWDLERLYSPDPDEPGTSYAREGGFLPDAADFDPAFFSISPREALGTDPQQRLLLEASWEALEDAGIDPLGLRGSPSGVFAGVMYQDYGAVEAGLAPGMSASVVSGRVAYALGLEGPAISVDTACSSSLVALHLACQALRGGECGTALAGGVTVLSTPWMLTAFARQRGLSPDGRCKAFAEAADGVGFAEGVGLLVLERLSEAEAKGRRILATIRGSAVNQDGASNGLTAPNGPSQERVIRQALANARLEPGEVDVVEAHGTGTTLGDPIEANALLATYGQERERPLLLGSVKSNIGHTQAAAGVAGVIKAVLAMGEGTLPKTLHVDTPSSKVDWEAGDIELLTEATEWKADGRPRRAGVSSFGASGTNAHLILEEAPVGGRDPDPGASAKEEGEGRRPLGGPLPFLLSARSPEALAAAAARLGDHLRAHPEAEPADLAFSLATTRARLEHRAAIIASDRSRLQDALAALAAGEPSPHLHTAKATSGRLAFLFTGQGSQRAGMGKQLYGSFPAYAHALDEACEQIDPRLDRPLKQLLFAAPGSEEAALLDHTTFAQPALFAGGLALYRLLASFGLQPELLIGHSVGEITAAHIAGVFDLPDAAKLICARGALMGELPEGGAMLAIEASEAEALASIEGKEELLSLAAVNAPRATVVSGDGDAIAEIEARWQAEERKTKRLTVSHAFHSPLIEPMLEPFAAVLAEISFHPPSLALVSNASGELLGAEQATDPAYWLAQAREPVRFADGVRTLKEQGADVYMELGPEAVLSAMAAATLQEEAEELPALIPTLREGREESECIVAALARAEVAGAKLDREALFTGTGAKAVPLPTYPFRRKRYWLGPQAGSDPGAIGLQSSEHPLLGAAIEDPEGGEPALSGRISLQTHPWLADHALGDTVLLPGTAFMELALEAARRADCEEVAELLLPAPLILPESGGVALRVKVGAPGEQGEREISIHSRPEGAEEAEWSCNARGLLAARAEQRDTEPLSQWPPEGASPLDADSLYDRLAAAGFDYGPAFQGLDAAWSRGEEIFAAVSLAPEQAGEAERFSIHPALLDAAFHAALLSPREGEEPAAALPFAWERIAVAEAGADALRVRIAFAGESASFELAGPDGRPLGRIGSLRTRPLPPEALAGVAGPREDLQALNWKEVPAGEGEARAKLLSLGELEIEDEGADAAAAALASTTAALRVVQEWIEAEPDPETPILALLTTSAVAAADGEDPDLAGAAVWGLLRSAQAEHPGRFALIDSDGTEASAEALPAALSACASEPQLALREGRLLAPRIGPPAQAGALVAPLGPWVLDAPKRGTLEGLALVPAPGAAEPLGPGQVRIAMRAAGLNFRDVMSVLGVYPGEAAIGGEGAGTVVEVGSEVEDLALGDRVLGMIPGAFGPLAIAERELLIRLPEGWSLEQGAALPLVHLTARRGLIDLADLKAGEKLLVHAGAGGVGMAAIQLARKLGAEVFATASPAKWDALRELGLTEDHISSSRDTEFKERFLEQTGGEGVDVVLNSLAGEFVDASLALLPRGGRFLEMGKTDVREPERVAAEHPGVTYRAFDLGEAGQARMGEMLGEIASLIEAGEITPSPIASWDVRRAPEAFRRLREGRNVGKVVLEIPRALDPDATVLISGGTGGLGGLLARHLLETHGARRLLLASRRGPQAEGAAELQAELEELGASVRIEACDVSDRVSLQALLDSVDPEHPLGAVVHTAGALDDGTIDSLDAERLGSVFAPKAEAAWHLHELTRELDLSAFVLFSSVAGVLGNPGQANYAAANSFLDALAAHRLANDLPATSIAWGLWERESGMTAALTDADKARLRRRGMEALSDQRGLTMFDAAILFDRSPALAAPIDPAGLRALAGAQLLPAILSDLVPKRSGRRRATVSLAARLASVPAAQQETVVRDLVRAETAAVLGHASAEEVAIDQPFKELGFDSLAAVELRNRLGAATDLPLPVTVVFDHPSVAALAEYLLAAVAPGAAGDSALRPDEREVREALASLPLSRLRSAGLIEPLLRLTNPEAYPEPEPEEEDGDRIDTMDVEELLQASGEPTP